MILVFWVIYIIGYKKIRIILLDILIDYHNTFLSKNDNFIQIPIHFTFPLFSATKGDIHYAMEIENIADLCNIVLRRLDRQNEFHTKADELLNSKGESKSGLSDTCKLSDRKNCNRLSMRVFRLNINNIRTLLRKSTMEHSM